MPDQIRPVSLVGFDPDAHKLMLAEWLKHPHARQWWGDPAENLHLAVTAPAELRQALILVDERPVGYLRWQLLDTKTLAAIHLPDPPEGVVDVDVLIGDPHYRGFGIAAAALRLLSSRLLTDPGIQLLVLCTSVENHAAVRAYEKAGFVRCVQYEDDQWGPCWVMIFPAGPEAA